MLLLYERCVYVYEREESNIYDMYSREEGCILVMKACVHG